MHRLTITALFAILLVSSGMQAQNLELGMTAGLSYYNGDLNPGLPFQDVKPAYGLVARYSNSTRWAYRLTLLNGTLSTTGANTRVDILKGSAFSKNFQEAGLVAEFNFFEYFTGSEKSYTTPFLFGGIGLTRISVLDTNASSDMKTILPFNMAFGFGWKYSLTKRLALSAEWGMRRSFTDRIDHAVGIPANKNTKVQWDDPGYTDWYNFTGIALTYRFSLQKKHTCDAFQNRFYKK